jgi:hypothetical protein
MPALLNTFTEIHLRALLVRTARQARSDADASEETFVRYFCASVDVLLEGVRPLEAEQARRVAKEYGYRRTPKAV